MGQQDKSAGLVPAGEEPKQYLTFTLGGEMYGVETLSVKEIIEYGQVTEVPMMPPPMTTMRACCGMTGSAISLLFPGPQSCPNARDLLS